MLTFKSRTHLSSINNYLLTSDIEDVAPCFLLLLSALSALFSQSLCFLHCHSVLLASCSLLTTGLLSVVCCLLSAVCCLLLYPSVLCALLLLCALALILLLCCNLWLPGI